MTTLGRVGVDFDRNTTELVLSIESRLIDVHDFRGGENVIPAS